MELLGLLSIHGNWTTLLGVREAESTSTYCTSTQKPLCCPEPHLRHDVASHTTIAAQFLFKQHYPNECCCSSYLVYPKEHAIPTRQAHRKRTVRTANLH